MTFIILTGSQSSAKQKSSSRPAAKESNGHAERVKENEESGELIYSQASRKA